MGHRLVQECKKKNKEQHSRVLRRVRAFVRGGRTAAKCAAAHEVIFLNVPYLNTPRMVRIGTLFSNKKPEHTGLTAFVTNVIHIYMLPEVHKISCALLHGQNCWLCKPSQAVPRGYVS